MQTHKKPSNNAVQSPMDLESDDVIAELAPGMGETLASGTQGLPWRLATSKASGEQLLFASPEAQLVLPKLQARSSVRLLALHVKCLPATAGTRHGHTLASGMPSLPWRLATRKGSGRLGHCTALRC